MCFGKKSSSQPQQPAAPAPPPPPTNVPADTSNAAQRQQVAAMNSTLTDPGKFGSELGGAQPATPTTMGA